MQRCMLGSAHALTLAGRREQEVEGASPLGQLRGTGNMLELRTDYFNPIPLVLQVHLCPCPHLAPPLAHSVCLVGVL